MTTLSLPYPLARQAADALLPHVSKEDITPALEHIAYRDGHLYATDRYTVGRFHVGAAGELPEGEVVQIPGAALRFAKQLAKTWLTVPSLAADYRVEFDISPVKTNTTRVVVSLVRPDGEVDAIRAFDGWAKNFPPVWTLLEKFTPGTAESVKFIAEHLGKITTYLGRGRAPMRLEAPEQKDGSSKLAPWRVTVDDRLVCLIQPNGLV